MREENPVRPRCRPWFATRRSDCPALTFCVTSQTCANGCASACSAARKSHQRKRARLRLHRCSRPISTPSRVPGLSQRPAWIRKHRSHMRPSRSLGPLVKVGRTPVGRAQAGQAWSARVKTGRLKILPANLPAPSPLKSLRKMPARASAPPPVADSGRVDVGVAADAADEAASKPSLRPSLRQQPKGRWPSPSHR